MLVEWFLIEEKTPGQSCECPLWHHGKNGLYSLWSVYWQTGKLLTDYLKYWHAGSKRLTLLTDAKAKAGCGLMVDCSVLRWGTSLLAKSVGSERKSFPHRDHLCCLFDSHWPKSSHGSTEIDFYWRLARWTSLILWVKSLWPSSVLDWQSAALAATPSSLFLSAATTQLRLSQQW